MAETPDSQRENEAVRAARASMNTAEVKAWFVREVLPLEAALMQYLHHNLGKGGDAADLRQDVYVRVCEAARKQAPDPVRPFVFTVARNLLIDRMRREQVVTIDAVSDLEALNIAIDAPGPERAVAARDELRRLQIALDRLSPRCREVVLLARVEGHTGRAIAARLGITESAVSQQLDNGMRALAEVLYGEPSDLRRGN
jgi:RNA polymerase sigma-70 factor (ECF subfamily)